MRTPKNLRVDQLIRYQEMHASVKKNRGESLQDAQRRRISLPKIGEKKEKSDNVDN